jgi:hypothetical protein
MEELTGSARQNAFQSFGGSGSWYRGLEVDHLSELEANVVADRILARLVNFMPTARKKVEILKPMAVDLIRHFLVDIELSDDWQSRFRRDILVKAHQHLSKQELSALRDAIGLGLRPVGDEQ